MGVESTIKSPSLENTFREYIRQYRALLRWGVDKVFQDTRIDILFLDIRQLIDSKETEKAGKLLADLKAQINLLEDQYPVQKNEIEKKLYARIQQLETIIENTNSIELNQTQVFLQTLEIARVAMQNEDWAEAKNKIESAESDVLANEVFEKTAISENAESESDKNILPPKLDNSDHSVTTEINVNLPETESKPNIEPKPNIDLNPIAQSLITTANKSIIGKSVSIQGLQKIFQSLNQSDFNTLRIGLVASPQIINTELSCLSRMTLIIEETGTELVLLRLPISRELTIYLVGIPLNSSLKGDQLEYITSQLSSVFINTTDSSDNDIAQLSDALTKITNTEIKLFLKDQLNIQPIKDEALHNKLEFTLIKDAGSVFIEDAAHHMDSYSQFE